MATLQGALVCACAPVGGAQRPRLPCFADKSEKFFVDTVLQSPRAAATVLKVATSLQFPSEDVMVDVGACACRLAPALAAACS